MLGNKLLNIRFAKYHIWNNKSEGFPNMVLSTETFNQSVFTEIDLIYTNYVDRVACSGVSHIGISDHSLIYVYRKLSLASFSTGHSTISYRNFLNLNRESFRNDTAQQDWFCNGSEDPNGLWTDWKT